MGKMMGSLSNLNVRLVGNYGLFLVLLKEGRHCAGFFFSYLTLVSCIYASIIINRVFLFLICTLQFNREIKAKRECWSVLSAQLMSEI